MPFVGEGKPCRGEPGGARRSSVPRRPCTWMDADGIVDGKVCGSLGRLTRVWLFALPSCCFSCPPEQPPPASRAISRGRVAFVGPVIRAAAMPALFHHHWQSISSWLVAEPSKRRTLSVNRRRLHRAAASRRESGRMLILLRRDGERRTQKER